MKLLQVCKLARIAAGNEEGGITVLSLFLFIVMLMAAGFAIDVNNAVQARTQLQGAADAAGHAALYTRYKDPVEQNAIDKGVAIAEANMPKSIYGSVLATADIEFGDWDGVKREFLPGVGSTAVRVTTRRTGSNGVSTFLLKLIGVDSFDLNTVSVWDYDEGWCPRGEGYFAVGRVDIQSNNHYKDGFCVHSETHVEFNQGSIFDAGVVVSMPNESDLVVPQSGMDGNTGLYEALDSINYNLTTFFNGLEDLVMQYLVPTASIQPSYITDMTAPPSTPKKWKTNVLATDIVPNAVNYMDCQNKTLTFDNNQIIKDAVIVTPCEVKFNSGAALENATLVVLNTGSKSVSAPSGLRIGSSTYCNDGQGGATLITMGDFSVASGLEVYGGNVISAGNLSGTSNANGLAGINFMAGGELDVTANGDMGFCNFGPPTPFAIPVFKMVM
ncbi:Tad domain-containing protein [Ovoidimarina sediminis]|uniref:Tad domain-containing protein n=1 Tax=Ovoidimarina sediminis TaxID=3079856 RepID=UPI00291477BA|nr:Tad domain-containing protein [Rhodophyticola sp. MJ-SS7]MDU8942118.1 Tad domain-containing protein [Rhodophyticola sp. MJ-SS7]